MMKASPSRRNAGDIGKRHGVLIRAVGAIDGSPPCLALKLIPNTLKKLLIPTARTPFISSAISDFTGPGKSCTKLTFGACFAMVSRPSVRREAMWPRVASRETRRAWKSEGVEMAFFCAGEDGNDAAEVSGGLEERKEVLDEVEARVVG